MMSYVKNHWQGQYPVSTSLWQGSTIAGLAALPVYFLCLWGWVVARHLTFTDFFASFLQGQSTPQPFYLWLLNEVSSDLIFIWWAVGVWRSCDLHLADASGKKTSHWVARSFVLLSVFFSIFCTASDLKDYIYR